MAETPLYNQMAALLSYANGVTGAGDTKLGDAVHSLADGYGGGGGGGLFIDYKISTVEVTQNIKLLSVFSQTIVEPFVRDGTTTGYDTKHWWLFKINDSDVWNDTTFGYVSNQFAYAMCGSASTMSLSVPNYRRYTGVYSVTSINIAYTTPSYANRDMGIKAGATIEVYKIPYIIQN